MTRQTTPSNPGCYHTAIQYMSEVTGISATKEVVYKNLDDLMRIGKNGKRKLKYHSSVIQVITNGGSRVPYMQGIGRCRFDILGIKAVGFVVTRYRELREFKLPYHYVGTYKDSYPELDGGGYSKIDLFKIEGHDFYFAPDMDCAHK
jgi:Zn-finger domain-containing protein